MANPLLNEKSINAAAGRDESQAGWGAPSSSTGTWAPPINDGPVSTWHGGLATVRGTASATLTLLLLLIASATVAWFSIAAPAADGTVTLPTGWLIGGVIVGLVSVLVATAKPHLARIAAPVYAIAEGVVVGAVSRAFETAYNGIVLQAVGATIGVFVVMLLMYRTGVVRVTDKFRRVIMGAMMGLMAFYLVSFIIGIFGSMPSFINDSSGLGIVFSLFVAGLAAFNLALDFDMIERIEREKMPAHMEWFGALGITVTLVWLYLEILRLLAKLQDRR